MENNDKSQAEKNNIEHNEDILREIQNNYNHDRNLEHNFHKPSGKSALSDMMYEEGIC